METKIIVMLENFDPLLDYTGKKVISLDPAVSYELGKNGIDYKILDDFYSEKELRKHEVLYFQEQLKWFDDFDVFFKNNITYCKRHSIPLAKANYLRFKYFVDTVIINAYMLEKYFRSNPAISEIIYVQKAYPADDEFSIFKFKSKNRIVFCNILQIFCAKYGVCFSPRIIDADKQRKKEQPSWVPPLLSPARSFLKTFININRYNKFKRFFEQSSFLKDLNVLFMHAGSPDIDIPLSSFIRHKGIVYVKEKNNVVREDALLRTKVNLPLPDKGFLERIEKDCRKCLQGLNKDPYILSWISKKSGIDVTGVVLPFFEQFIARDVPYILRKTKKMFDFYEKHRIDYVFSRGNTDRDSQGALIAAKYMKGAKSICMGHSCFAVNAEVYGVFETETYDYVFARDDISMDFFENFLDKQYKTDCRVLQSAHYLMSIEQAYLGSGKSRKNGREKIVYVEKKFSDRVRHFNTMSYTFTWYFKFLKSLIDYFGNEKKFDFIYKHAQMPGQEWSDGSILKYIEDKKYSNITVSQSPFVDVLKKGDRFIVDYLSGSFFEAALSRKPVLCTLADYIRIYPVAKDVFGKSIQPFSSAEDAISVIKSFLFAEPEDFTVKVPFSRKNFVENFNCGVLKKGIG